MVVLPGLADRVGLERDLVLEPTVLEHAAGDHGAASVSQRRARAGIATEGLGRWGMDDLEPLLRFWRAHDALFERVEPAWWGAVVSDARFPAIREPNYARIETAEPVALAEIEERLLPAIRRIGGIGAHAVVFEPEEQTNLIAAASMRGERITWRRSRTPTTTSGPSTARRRRCSRSRER